MADDEYVKRCCKMIVIGDAPYGQMQIRPISIHYWYALARCYYLTYAMAPARRIVLTDAASS
jgi:hypothetical protein